MISGFGLGRKPARISGGRRGRCAGERCGDDGSDPWGRPVSGTQRRGRGRASAGVGGWQLGPGCSGSGLGLWRVGRAAVCGACSRGETGVRARVAGRPRGRVLRAGVRVGAGQARTRAACGVLGRSVGRAG